MLLILFHLLIQSTFASSPGYDVGITVEAAFIESCVNIEPLYLALDQLKLVQASLHHYSSTFKLQNVFLGNMGLKLEQNLKSEISSIEMKLSQFGFIRDHDYELDRKIGGFGTVDNLIGHRAKRGAFDFVSEGASYLFGFVSASQYRGLKNHIKNQFDIIQDQENQLLSSVAENRDHLNRALVSLNSFKKDFQSFTNGFTDLFLQSEHFLGISIQISFALSSVQSLVSTLEIVRNNADHFYPSRYVTSREKLKAYILYLSDTLSDISPVFSSSSIDNYFRYQIATTANLKNKICQIVRIPLISHYGKFEISHTQVCPSGRVCLSNHQGSVQVSVSDYASCLGVHFSDLPTLCTARPCLSSEDISCIMLNLTTALVASKDHFQATIKCKRARHLDVIGIVAITIPLNCFIHSPKLKIDKVQLMKHRSTSFRAINLPFVILGDSLLVNDTAIGGQSIFENSQLSQLILPKLQNRFNQTILGWHTSRNSVLSVTATSASCVLLLILGIYLVKKFYSSCLKPRFCSGPSDNDTSSNNDDVDATAQRRASSTVYDPADTRSGGN